MSKSCCSRRRPRGLRPGLLAAAASLVLAGCAAGPEDGPVVARVGDATLTLAQLTNQVPDSDMAAQQRRLYVDSWVRRQLLYQEAVAREVDQTPQVRQLIEQSRRDLVIAAFLDGLFDDREITVSDADVEQYYHLHADEFRRPDAELRAQQIVLGSRRDATALRSELLRGAVFEDKVRELSIDRETNTVGGDLGYFTADERPEIWEACADVGPGQLCRPVTLDGAFHIVRLTERREAESVRDLTEPAVRDRILDALVRQKHGQRVDELVTGLRAEHDWSVDETQLAAQ